MSATEDLVSTDAVARLSRLTTPPIYMLISTTIERSTIKFQTYILFLKKSIKQIVSITEH